MFKIKYAVKININVRKSLRLTEGKPNKTRR